MLTYDEDKDLFYGDDDDQDDVVDIDDLDDLLNDEEADADDNDPDEVYCEDFIGH